MNDDKKQSQEDLKKTQPEVGFPKEEKKEDSPMVDGAVDEAKDQLSDKLDVPGGLEIEEMKESAELQRRREEQRKKLTELTEKVDEPEVNVPGDNPFSDGAGGLKEMLEEANLSTRHLKFCCGGVIAVAFVAVLIWGGVNFVKSLGDGEKQDKKVVQEEVVEEESTIEVSEDVDDSVLAAVLVGADEVSLDEGVVASEALGVPSGDEDEFAQMVLDFAAIYNLMDVDVQQLLDRSDDRREALDDYVDDLNFHLFLGKENKAELEDAVETLSANVDRLTEEKDAAELEFFSDLRNLDAYGSRDALDDFVFSTNDVTRVKAELQARSKLLSYYDLVLEDVELRLRDIELNEEALVKGVRVVDIEGSDLRLIIDESSF